MKKVFQMLLALGVIAIGMYMLLSYDLPTPPALSGFAFLLTGLSLWMPHCPVCKTVFK